MLLNMKVNVIREYILLDTECLFQKHPRVCNFRIHIAQRFSHCRAPQGGAVAPMGGASSFFMRDILNEIWAQDKIYIFVGTCLVEV
jgi:hypothetical protein